MPNGQSGTVFVCATKQRHGAGGSRSSVVIVAQPPTHRRSRGPRPMSEQRYTANEEPYPVHVHPTSFCPRLKSVQDFCTRVYSSHVVHHISLLFSVVHAYLLL
jgi:hypothetical protein